MEDIQSETAAVRAAVEEQKERIDKTTEEVKSVVVEMRDGEIKTRDEMREIRDEVTNIREMLPRVNLSCIFEILRSRVCFVLWQIDDREKQRISKPISEWIAAGA